VFSVRLSVWLDFSLLCDRFPDHSITFIWFSGVKKIIKQSQRQRVQWLCTRALEFFVILCKQRHGMHTFSLFNLFIIWPGDFCPLFELKMYLDGIARAEALLAF